METIWGMLIIAFLGYLIWIAAKPSSPTTSATGAAPYQPPSTELQKAHRLLSGVISACQVDHDEAVAALIFMASSDGTVSRQELRIIIGFCERQGTTVDAGWVNACDHINAGLKIAINGGEAGARENIEALTGKPVKYRAAFLGAAEAIVASNKTSNATKRRLIEQIRNLI